MKFHHVIIAGILFTSPLTLIASPTIITVGAFSHHDLSAWQPQDFHGKTAYSLQPSRHASYVLSAHSDNSASGLHRKIRIDLITQTPVLNWSWRVPYTFTDNDEASKSGDDYPARIYVIVSGGPLFWKTRALNYVWSNQQKESTWANAYTSRNIMLAVDGGEQHTQRWRHYSRNLRHDLQRIFGEDIRSIDAIAIMTDTDNTHHKVTTLYGDIYFSSE